MNISTNDEKNVDLIQILEKVIFCQEICYL